MKHSSEDAYSDLRERALVKKLRTKLWPLEVQLPTGWLWYRQLVDEESKNSIGATSSEYPKITKPPYLKHHNDEIFQVNPLTGKLEGSTCPENPRINKLQTQVAAVRQGANVTIRKFRKAKTLRALVDSGLTRDDYFHVLSRISMMFEDSKAEDYWVSTGLRPGVLRRILSTPTEYEVWEPECSLFSDRGRNYQSVNENCTFDTHQIRDRLFELAFLNARRCAARIRDAYSTAAVTWLQLLNVIGREQKRRLPAYTASDALTIERLLEKAVSLQWAEQYVGTLREGKFSDPVTRHAQSVLRSYVRGKCIVFHDGFSLTSDDSSNESLWEGIHALACKSDEEGFVKLGKGWKRNNRRTGMARSRGAAQVSKFLKYVQPKTVGRGGVGMYRLVGEPM